MLIVSYDIASDKLRNKFSKFLKKFGRRIQYSVYEIRNSDRHVANVQATIHAKFEPHFSKSDSVFIIPISKADEEKTIRYGYAKNEEYDFLFIE